MNDKQQTKKIAQDIAYNCIDLVETSCDGKPCYVCIAEKLAEQGYRKIPEDSVVIPNEKFIKANKVYSYSTLKSYTKSDLIEHIRILEHNWADAEERIDNQAKHLGKLIKQLEQTRKETAREIIATFADLFPKEKGISSSHAKIHRFINELAKQYGVEVEE